MNDYSFDTGSIRQHRSNHASGAQTLHRQPSRQQFESFSGHQSDGVYGQNGLASRFENQNRGNDRYDGMPAPGQNGHNSYDMGMPQAWNNSNYSHNHLAALGATNRRQQPAARGRPGLPSVSFRSCISLIFQIYLTQTICRAGSTKLLKCPTRMAFLTWAALT